MEQFWRQIRIQRAQIHKTSLVRSPAQGTFFFVGLCYFYFEHFIKKFLVNFEKIYSGLLFIILHLNILFLGNNWF